METIVSPLLLGRINVRLTATAVRRARRQQLLLMIAHIHRIVCLRCRSDRRWLRAGRLWACTRPLQSVYSAADLVRRRRVRVRVDVKSAGAVGRVIQRTKYLVQFNSYPY